MGMYGLIKANSHAYKQVALSYWDEIAGQAKAAGREDLIEKYRPKADASWRTIDKCSLRLKAALEVA